MVPSVPFLVIGIVLASKILLGTGGAIGGSRINRTAGAILSIWMFVVLLDIGTASLSRVRGIPTFRLWPSRSYDPPPDVNFTRYLRDAPAIGRYLRDMTAGGDRIFVWGFLGSRLYFESDRLPAGKL